MEIKVEVIQGVTQRAEALVMQSEGHRGSGVRTDRLTLSTLHRRQMYRYLLPAPLSMKYFRSLGTRAIFNSVLQICSLQSLTSDCLVNVW